MENKFGIKKGDVFYSVYFDKIVKYEYLCPYPLKTISTYHIVLNRSIDLPERIHEGILGQILSEGLKTYDQAKEKVIHNLKDRIAFYQLKDQ